MTLTDSFGLNPPTTVLAIDPGPKQSGFCFWNGTHIMRCGIWDNEKLRLGLVNADIWPEWTEAVHIDLDEDPKWEPTSHLAIEMIASYGMPVGASVFETCVWIGRFISAWGWPQWSYVYRREVKLHLTDSPRSKDSNVSQALRDRFGWTRSDARKLGLKTDVWAALGVAVTYHDTMRKE